MGKRAVIRPGALPTRWWSTLPLMEAVLKQYVGLATFMTSFSSGRYSHLILSASERALLKTVVTVLKPLEIISAHMASESHVTASAILPLVKLIEESGTGAAPAAQSASVDEEDSEWEDLEDEDSLPLADIQAKVSVLLKKLKHNF